MSSFNFGWEMDFKNISSIVTVALTAKASFSLHLGDTYLKSWMTEFFKDFFSVRWVVELKKNTIFLTKARKEQKKKSMIHWLKHPLLVEEQSVGPVTLSWEQRFND